MSNYLSCVIECESQELACRLCKLLDRRSRPIFEEDVLEYEADYFAVIQEVEYPSSVITVNKLLVATWVEKDNFNFDNLLPVFSLSGVSLLLAHELDSYIGSGDENEDEKGRFWFVKREKLESCNAAELNKRKYSRELELFRSAWD